MKQRIITAGIGLVLLAVVLMFYKHYVLNICIALVVVVAMHEILNVEKLTRNYPLAFVTYAYALSVPLLALNGLYWLYPYFTVTYALILMTISVAQYKKVRFEQLSFVFMMSFIIPFSLSCVLFIRNIYKEDSLFLVLLALAGGWLTDSGAYFSGRFFGKHKMSPNISPKKTVEGAVGGVIICTVGFLLIGWIDQTIYRQIGASIEISYLNLAIISVVCSLSGIIGDLSASVIKRQFNMKDFGTIMPGHGGIMDRFDSVVFTAPVFFILLKILPVI